MGNLENIINEAWENKDQVNQNSDKLYFDYKINNLPSFLQEINVLRDN